MGILDDAKECRFRAAALAGVAVFALSACGMQVPEDPEGTLASVSEGTLRVGAAIEPNLVEQNSAARNDVTGPLVEVVDGFAESLRAEVEWHVHSEESLVAMLESGEIDLAVGGFTESTAWSDRAGASRGYGVASEPGRRVVLLVPLGENRFLSELEAYLDEELEP